MIPAPHTRCRDELSVPSTTKARAAPPTGWAACGSRRVWSSCCSTRFATGPCTVALALLACISLRQLEGSPLPLGARIQRQQTALTVTIAAAVPCESAAFRPSRSLPPALAAYGRSPAYHPSLWHAGSAEKVRTSPAPVACAIASPPRQSDFCVN